MAKEWMTIDAKGQSFGRLASRLAVLLQGKEQPSYSPHIIQAPQVIVINCAEVKVSVNRSVSEYVSHSGYLGNMKKKIFTDKTNSARLTTAVRNMLPSNKSRATLVAHLHCYETTEHPHKAQTT